MGTKRIKPGKARIGHLTHEPGKCGGRKDGRGREGAFAPDFTFDVPPRRYGWRTVIGYANQPGKADQLTQVDADAVTTELDEITTALRAAPRSCTRARTAELSRI